MREHIIRSRLILNHASFYHLTIVSKHFFLQLIASNIIKAIFLLISIFISIILTSKLKWKRDVLIIHRTRYSRITMIEFVSLFISLVWFFFIISSSFLHHTLLFRISLLDWVSSVSLFDDCLWFNLDFLSSSSTRFFHRLRRF
jgi:hypothetical protein